MNVMVEAGEYLAAQSNYAFQLQVGIAVLAVLVVICFLAFVVVATQRDRAERFIREKKMFQAYADYLHTFNRKR